MTSTPTDSSGPDSDTDSPDVTVTDHGDSPSEGNYTELNLEEPDQSTHPYEISIDGVVENEFGDSMVIDFYHGRPVLYIWEPGYEDAQHALALPTEDDPTTRPYIVDGKIVDETEEILSNTESASP